MIGSEQSAMANPAVRGKPCIALIADMVRSRELPRAQRPRAQERFKDLVGHLNKTYSRNILSRFVITLGDEFQGLLSSATPIPDLMWDIEHRFSDRNLRVGMGFGALHTPIQKEALNVDGPALHLARAAIQTAHEKRLYGGVFLGFGELDPVMNGLARILWFQRSRLTKTQLTIAELLRQGRSQSEAAEKLNITRQAVSKQVISMGWWPYAVASDPLPEDRDNANFSWRTWRMTLPVRIAGSALLSYGMTHSIVTCGWLTTLTAIHPWIRLRSPLKWIAEIEVLVLISNLLFMLAFVRNFHLQLHTRVPTSLTTEHLAAISIVGSILLFVVRGGTYIVRGCLHKTGTLPHITVKNADQHETSNPQDQAKSPGIPRQVLPPSSPSSPEMEGDRLDVTEINRGRLIGNLERLILTIAVAVRRCGY